jgi:hypothetical protein
MKLSLTVIHDGDTQTVTCGPVDMVAFEREHKCAIKVIAEEQKMEHLCWLAWQASRRTRKTVLDFDAWIDGLEDISVEDEGTEVPLAPTA